MLIYNIHTIIKQYELYNPFYIELQETIVGKYLNIIHTYIHIKQMNTISTSSRILQNVLTEPVYIRMYKRQSACGGNRCPDSKRSASKMFRQGHIRSSATNLMSYESNLAMSISMYTRKTCPCNVYTLDPHFYIEKLGFAGVYLFFLFLLQNIDCGYSLEPPRRGGSNVYPQSMF